MASKLIYLVVALCTVQFAQSADVEKRSIFDIPFIGPILNNTFNGAQNLVSNTLGKLLPNVSAQIAKAEDFIKNITSKASAVNNAATGPLQSLLGQAWQKIQDVVKNSVQYGWNSTLCVTGQKDHAQNITEQAAKNIFGCTQATTQKAMVTFADMKSVNSQVLSLARDVPGELFSCVTGDFSKIFPCIANITQFTSSKSLMYTSSLAQDVGSLGQLAFQLPGTLTKCGSDQISKATTEIGVLISDIGDCMKKNAQSS